MKIKTFSVSLVMVIASALAGTLYSSGNINLIIAMLIGIVAVLGGGFLFSGGRGDRRMGHLIEGLNEVVNGDYGYNFKKVLGTEGAFGEAANHLDDVLISVNSMIAKMKVSGEQNSYESDKVYKQIGVSTDVANNINGAVEKIAYDSTEQNDYIEDIHKNSEHMNTLANSIAEKCQANYDLATVVEKNVGHASNYVDNLLEGIQTTGDISKMSAQKIHDLKNRVEEIANFITVVNQISDQTNLLALNASIESARAGEAGKGFAVVADEVRKLAEQSKMASEDIVKIVHEVLLETNSVVAQIDSNNDNVQSSADMVVEVKTLIAQAAESMKTMEDDIDNIRVITEEQASEAEKIANSIEKVSGLSNEIASEAQGVYASCEEQSASIEEIMISCEVLAKSSQDALSEVKEFSKGIKISGAVKKKIENLQNQLERLAKTEDFISMDYNSHKTGVERVAREDKGFSVVYTASTATEKLHFINIDLTMGSVAFREWYSQPLKTKGSYTSEIYVPLGSDSPCVTVAVPIVGASQEVVGVLGADLVLSDLA